MQNVLPTPMSTLFTSSEIRKAIWTLKNNKIPGMDQINVELIKYSPEVVCEKIAATYNNIAATGKHPNKITHGILRALQKPGKPKGPTSNLRPIILLSVLRKILAVCAMKRINSRLDSAIPMSQAAYRKNRSTTEHVFATKLIIERTISTDETVYLFLLDMSKAFDSIQRNTLIEDLKNVLNQDELHLIRILLDVKVAAQFGNYKSRFFSTDTGAPQEDCASASEFTFYLVESLEATIANDAPSLEEHNDIPSNYPIVSPNYQIDIDQQYADDISRISTSISAIGKMKDELPAKLAQRGLKINESKTEEYTIKRANCDNRWRDCKLLGSLLDTQKDIKRRKVLAINAANKLKHLFLNKDVTISVKTTLFKSYITPIFLYNSELWTLTNNMQRKEGSFQRRIIRTFVLNVRWPTIVKNEEIFTKTKLELWSIIIGKRCLKWFGKIARMDPSTSARSALHYALEEFRRPRGRPPKTWLSIMKQQLRSELNMNWNEAFDIAKDENVWKTLIKDCPM